MKRTFTIPPGLWWHQSEAGRLEAERLSPLASGEARITMRRINFWRPNAAAEFEATYERISAEADGTMAAPETPSTFKIQSAVVAGAAAIAILLASATPALKQQSIVPTPPSSRPGVPAPPQISKHATVAKLLDDLAEIGRHKGSDVLFHRLQWTPDEVTIETDPASVENVRSSMSAAALQAHIVVKADGGKP